MDENAQFPGLTADDQLVAATKDMLAAITRAAERPNNTKQQIIKLNSLLPTLTEAFTELRERMRPTSIEEEDSNVDAQRVIVRSDDVPDRVRISPQETPPTNMLFIPLPNVDREDKTVKADLFTGQQRSEDTLSEEQRQVRLKDQAKREREEEDTSRKFKLAQDAAIAKQLADDEELARSMASEDPSSKGAEVEEEYTEVPSRRSQRNVKKSAIIGAIRWMPRKEAAALSKAKQSSDKVVAKPASVEAPRWMPQEEAVAFSKSKQLEAKPPVKSRDRSFAHNKKKGAISPAASRHSTSILDFVPIKPKTYKGLKGAGINSVERIYLGDIPEERLKELEEFLCEREVNNIASAANHEVNLDAETSQPITWGTCLKGPDLEIWLESQHKEYVNLIDYEKTIKFILPDQKEDDTPVTYVSMQPKVKHVEGNLDRRVRACLGGNLDVGITGERTSPVATMSQCKILANSVISDPKSFWMSLDLKNFFLKTKLEKKAYFRTHISKVPKKTVEMYNLSSLADSRGFLLAEVSGGMYGHPQAGKFAYEGLRAHLAQNGFHSKDETPCIFANADYSIVFAVIVDDFAVKVRSKEDGQLLINILEKKYEVKVDWSGRFYNGVEWVFQYEGQRSLKICMPGYIKSVLKRFACTDIPGVHTPAIATVVRYLSRVSHIQYKKKEEKRPGERLVPAQ